MFEKKNQMVMIKFPLNSVSDKCIYMVLGAFLYCRRTVQDKATMREVILTDEELDIIDRLQTSQFPEAGYDPYEVT